MIAKSHKSRLSGRVSIPASKSHTIRGLLLGTLADGVSTIRSPLESFDTLSAAMAARALGAEVDTSSVDWTIRGLNGSPRVPEDIIDVGNSGTTLYMIMGTAALAEGWTVITGDGQIRSRTASPLISALSGLGATVISSRDNGCAPLMIQGKLSGGECSIESVTSQYLSSLLMTCPFADGDSIINVPLLNEAPYVYMTLDWLDFLGIKADYTDDLSMVNIAGRQRCKAFDRRIPGDFSSAAFPLSAAVLAGGEVTLEGLYMNDTQGDKAVIGILRDMGADIEIDGDLVTVRGSSLKGIEIDMNAIPDAIPMLSVVACFAEGTTVLGNVPQARLKETDRIAVMAAELAKLGADVEELPDGLVIKGGGLRGGSVHGHGDHRIVMALTIAAFAADGPISVDTAEAAGVTYPGFWDSMTALGADIELDGE